MTVPRWAFHIVSGAIVLTLMTTVSLVAVALLWLLAVSFALRDVRVEIKKMHQDVKSVKEEVKP